MATTPTARRADDQESTTMRTVRLCATPSRRPTTLLGAIARSVAELERAGRPARSIRLPVSRGAFA
jgi:hypothetical protein